MDIIVASHLIGLCVFKQCDVFHNNSLCIGSSNAIRCYICNSFFDDNCKGNPELTEEQECTGDAECFVSNGVLEISISISKIFILKWSSNKLNLLIYIIRY